MASTRHTSFMVGNVQVTFPHEPYDTQRQYIECVIKALTGKHHALLESPTGTGKTLSLLCSSLAWLSNQDSTKTKIYYTSRTHMQLAQAAKEMKCTAYGGTPSVVIGSRSQMCLNEEVRQQAGDHLINRACRNAITKNACSFHSNYEQKLETMDQNKVHDIEDLIQFGRNHQCCPYYASRKIAETKASLIFMPYNYLLDTSLKKTTQLKLDNSVIIFDEAHNIESVLKDAVSGSFTQSCLNTIQESCLKLPAKVHEALNQEKHGLSRNGYDPNNKRNAIVDEFTKPNGKQDKEVKLNPIEELAENLTNERLQQVNRCADLLKQETRNHMELDRTSSIEKVFRIMEMAGIQYTTSNIIVTTLDSMASFWSIAGVMNPALVARYVSAITNLSHVISLLFPEECISVVRQTNHESRLTEYYTAYLKGTYATSMILRQGELKDWELNLWCLHPAIGLKRVIDSNCINGPRSLIVTSGTLAPVRPIEKELETEFRIVKEFKHIITEEQLKIMIIGQAPNSYSLESHFEATKKDDYSVALGKTLLAIFKILPYGTLVFFQSYSLMNRVIKFWKDKSTIWRDLIAVSPIFIESKTQESFLSDVMSYKKKIDSCRNARAVFFGVCRGKLSEGVNLEGNHCRTVILTGLPFPSLTDPKVVSTRKFHEKKGDNRGSMWYSQQMTRALNQTIGRIIRSKSDFGMLLLCDPRFRAYKYSLSEWTRKFFPAEITKLDTLDVQVKDFFRHHGIAISGSITEDIGAFELGLSSKSTLSGIFNLSPFSEEGSKGSQASSRVSNRSIEVINSSPEIRSVQDRQAAILANYRVDKATYDRVKKSRLNQVNETEGEGCSKRPKTTSDIFEFICSQPQLIQPTQIQTCDISRSAPQTITAINCSNTDFSSRLEGNQTHQNSTQCFNLDQVYVPKPPPKSLNIFKKRKTNQNVIPKSKQTQSTDPISSQVTNTTHDYSILNQFRGRGRPAGYICYICRNAAENPYRTNCPCCSVGCLSCLKVLNKKKCGKCKTLFMVKDFKQLLFMSAARPRERNPNISLGDSRK